MDGNEFNNNQFTDQNINSNNMFNQNNINNSNQNDINYNSIDTKMCTNNKELQNNNKNFFGDNYNQYIDSTNNKMINNNNNQNNNQNINENNQNQNQTLIFAPEDNNIPDETFSQLINTKEFINDKNFLKEKIPIKTETKVIQNGDFDETEGKDIQNICISLFDSSHPYEQTNVEKISQKLKLKYDGEWFVLISEQASQNKRLNFDFKFSNLKWEEIFILSHLTHRFYIGKIKNINN